MILAFSASNARDCGRDDGVFSECHSDFRDEGWLEMVILGGYRCEIMQ